MHYAAVQRTRSGQRITQVMNSLHQKGAIGRFSTFGIDRRAKKMLNAVQIAMGKYIFNSDAQTAFNRCGTGAVCLGAFGV